jgi:fermentation-respiration switch protein FrsA (DUF1100 family)
MLYVLSAYVIICILAFLFQRKLVYPGWGWGIEDSDPAASGILPRRARNLELVTEDGVKLGAWHMLPDGKETEDFDAALKDGAPVFLFFHGNGGNRTHRVDFYHVFTRAGCHVIAIDYRGYGDSRGKPSSEGLARDARAVWTWALERGVTPDRVVLYGESLGCAVAVRLAQEQSLAGAPPAGLALECPFASLQRTARSLYWFLPVRLILRESFPSDERIVDVTCPILIQHGRHDRIVEFKHGRMLFEAAPERSAGGTPKRFVEYPNASHCDLRYADPARYETELRTFLATACPVTANHEDTKSTKVHKEE